MARDTDIRINRQKLYRQLERSKSKLDDDKETVDEYLARGGIIEKVPFGASSFNMESYHKQQSFIIRVEKEKALRK